ncbi:MAG: tetratricopeptide repeat protein [Candidatus Eisenbacteria bacterium]|nr:tetratricopeptide repeat protein [Candidatus Eisenbacteria bacterium]
MRLRLLAFLSILIAAPASGETGLLKTVRDAREALVARAERDSAGTWERARSLIDAGRREEAATWIAAHAPATRKDEMERALLLARLALGRHDFGEARARIEEAEGIDPSWGEAFLLRLEILEATEDWEAVDSATTARLKRLPGGAAARIGRGDLRLALHELNRAEEEYEEALAVARRPEEGVAALAGLMRVAYGRNDFDEALDLAKRTLEAGSPSPACLEEAVRVLVRLGETGEAIALAEETLLWNPWSEKAHYFLGNGYARLNYTDLEASRPEAFPDPAARASLDSIRAQLASGEKDRARGRLIAFRANHPELAEPEILLGSLFWEEGEPDSAIARFAAALERCPEHGRAHNGFAKAMEWKRLRANPGRDAYEREFAETPEPEIPGIDSFVVNYESLSPRHRKRVALSVAPWARFVPVLAEAGATFYVKPLYEKLSEAPRQAVLRDRRIEYDSRLWDDVRGCGGFHTVTGLEDVERNVFGKYNTVLHELTHQVHHVLTPEEKRRIEEAYRRAKEREAAGERVFVSRYQGSSVWEYFAEGMNSLASPRRDRYDTREILRERLEEMDPELTALIAGIAADTAIARYRVPALTAAAYDRLESGLAGEALPLLEKALARSPKDETALSALAYTRSVTGDPEGAEKAAMDATRAHGGSAGPWLEQARAVFLKTGSWSERIAVLLRAREKVDRDQKARIESALGRAYLGRGDLRKAQESFRWVLEYRRDDPEALWGAGEAHGLAGDEEEADRFFGRALLGRNGIAELRADYARFLIREGRFDEAETQIEEARLLEPTNSDAAAAAGLLAIYLGDWEEARRLLEEAAGRKPQDDLIRILLGHTLVAEGEAVRAESLLAPILSGVERSVPPLYVFIEERGEYEETHTYPAEERWLLYRTAAEMAEARGDGVAAAEYRRETEQVFR